MRPTLAAVVAIGAYVWVAGSGTAAHDFNSTITWNREISRLVFDRCVPCHREGGTSFALMTYADAQPRATAIKDAVLSRRMPPWGAVKGFGNFRNDRGLTQEQIELFAAWVEGGIRRGNNAAMLPPPPTAFAPADSTRVPAGSVVVGHDTTLTRDFTADGLIPQNVRRSSGMQITAVLPDKRVVPLVWLYEYREMYQHPFLFRRPIQLPAGTVIRGVKAPARIALLPVVPVGGAK
ncbi:MAG: hypothetical protein ABI652_03960 [Acidobacteriota bacterium]